MTRCLLLGTLGLLALASPSGAVEPKLPADLAAVPDEALSVVCITVPEWLKDAKLARLHPLLREHRLDRLLGPLGLVDTRSWQNIERVTFFHLNASLDDVLMLVRTKRATAPERLLGKDAVDAGVKIAALDDRTFILATVLARHSFEHYRNTASRKRVQGRFRALLVSAHKEKPLLVGSVAANRWIQQADFEERVQSGAIDLPEPDPRVPFTLPTPQYRAIREIEATHRKQDAKKASLFDFYGCSFVDVRLASVEGAIRVGANFTYADARAAEHGKQTLEGLRRAITTRFLTHSTTVEWGWDSEEANSARLITEARKRLDAIGFKVTAAEVRLSASLPLDAKTEAFATKTRPAQREQDRLKSIGLAIHSRIDDSKNFTRCLTDAKGRPLLSWRVALLPQLGQEALFRQFKLDEPWDSDHNKKLLAKMPTIYAAVGRVEEPPSETETPYQLFVGPTTCFPRLGSQVQIAEITDGMSNTMMLGESSRLVPWTKPEDMEVTDRTLPKLGGHFRTFTQVLMWDGSVRRIKRGLDDATLRPFLTIQGGERVDAEKLKP